jgi:hypothetical protein
MGVASTKQIHDKVVRVYPTEVKFDPKDKSGRKVLSERCWETDKFGRFFASKLTAKQLYDVVTKTRIKLPNLALFEEGDLIMYQYKGRPMIRLSRGDGQFYAAASEIELFGKPAVEHQAHMVLEMLKTHSLSDSSMGKPVHLTSARNMLSNLKTYK